MTHLQETMTITRSRTRRSSAVARGRSRVFLESLQNGALAQEQSSSPGRASPACKICACFTECRSCFLQVSNLFHRGLSPYSLSPHLVARRGSRSFVWPRGVEAVTNPLPRQREAPDPRGLGSPGFFASPAAPYSLVNVLCR